MYIYIYMCVCVFQLVYRKYNLLYLREVTPPPSQPVQLMKISVPGHKKALIAFDRFSGNTQPGVLPSQSHRRRSTKERRDYIVVRNNYLYVFSFQRLHGLLFRYKDVRDIDMWKWNNEERLRRGE
jgi:hypothetical protein